MANSNRLDISSLAFWSFALSIALFPIGLGGDRPIPLGLAQAGLAFSSICLALSPETIQKTQLFTRLRWAIILFVGVLIWATVQTLPIVPQHWTHPLWQETVNVLNQPAKAAISIVPEDANKGLMRLLTYSAAGLLAYVFGQSSRRAKQFFTTFWMVGTAICIYGLTLHLLGLEEILWFKKWAYQGDNTGTFVNHNHFAIYAGMVLTVGFGLLRQSWRTLMRTTKPHQRVDAVREWLLRKGFPRGALLLITLVSLVQSHSRAGLICSLGGLGAFLFLYQVYLRSWRRAMILGVLVLVALVVTLGVASQISEHFAVLFNDYSSEGRSKVYDIAWRALLDNPWLGYGLNGFEPEYRLYQHNMYEEFNHVHSDILESLLDLGFIGGLALWSALALFVSGLWHGIRNRRQDGVYPTLALAVSLMVLAHACVDFDMQIPGIAMSWSALLGVGLAQSWGQTERKEVQKLVPQTAG